MMDSLYTGPKMEVRRSSGGTSDRTFIEAPCELDQGDFDKEAQVYSIRLVEVESKDGCVSVEEGPLPCCLAPAGRLVLLAYNGQRSDLDTRTR